MKELPYNRFHILKKGSIRRLPPQDSPMLYRKEKMPSQTTGHSHKTKLTSTILRHSVNEFHSIFTVCNALTFCPYTL